MLEVDRVGQRQQRHGGLRGGGLALVPRVGAAGGRVGVGHVDVGEQVGPQPPVRPDEAHDVRPARPGRRSVNRRPSPPYRIRWSTDSGCRDAHCTARGAPKEVPIRSTWSAPTASTTASRVSSSSCHERSVSVRLRVRQAAAGAVVAHEGAAARERLVEHPLRRERPPELEVGQPARGQHEEGTGTGQGVRDAAAVGQPGRAEPLLHVTPAAAGRWVRRSRPRRGRRRARAGAGPRPARPAQQVVAGVQRYQPAAPDQRGERDPLLEGDPLVVATVQDQRRHVEGRGGARDVHVEAGVEEPQRVLGRGGAAHELGEVGPQLRVARPA